LRKNSKTSFSETVFSRARCRLAGNKKISPTKPAKVKPNLTKFPLSNQKKQKPKTNQNRKKKNQHKNSPPQKKVDSDRLYNNALQKMSADIVHFGHVHGTNFQIKLAHP